MFRNYLNKWRNNWWGYKLLFSLMNIFNNIAFSGAIAVEVIVNENIVKYSNLTCTSSCWTFSTAVYLYNKRNSQRVMNKSSCRRCGKLCYRKQRPLIINVILPFLIRFYCESCLNGFYRIGFIILSQFLTTSIKESLNSKERHQLKLLPQAPVVRLENVFN